MADIAPFRGVRYTSKAGDPSKLVAPPYDVISDEERRQLAALDPHNCVRLILPETSDLAGDKGAGGGDKDKQEKQEKKEGEPSREAKASRDDAKYQSAAEHYRRWLADGTLAADERPAIYRYHQVFDTYGKTITRKGFIARVRLQRFDEKVILPHERTLSGPKEDRLKLMRATRAHFSQIFGLYEDRQLRSDALFEELEQTPPVEEARTSDGVLHRLWMLTDPDRIRTLARMFEDMSVYIADGHHRYETMIALRDELGKDAPARSAVNFGTMFFCNMEDPGLVVLPTHRVLFGLPAFDRAEVLRRAREYFTVQEGPLADAQVIRQALAGHGKRGPTIALVTPGASTVAYLRVRGDLIRESVPALAHAKVLNDVDVTLLHGLLLESILGIDRAAQEKQTNLRYVKDWEKAMKEVDAPGVQAVLLMNPTRVEQLKAVSDAGEVMPQKSTYFYPKIASALVINPIDPNETVPQVTIA